MSPVTRSTLLTAVLAALAAGPCAGQNTTSNTATPSGRIMAPPDDSSKNVASVAESPLHDLNLVHQKIPTILQYAVANPYLPLRRVTCRTLTAEISRLYVALGRDFDDPLPPRDKNVTHSGGTGLRLLHNAAEWLIPYDGFVRTLTGAQRRDQAVVDAITAGDTRRAYLKGLGEARHCPAPASPSGHGYGFVAHPFFQ